MRSAVGTNPRWIDRTIRIVRMSRQKRKLPSSTITFLIGNGLDVILGEPTFQSILDYIEEEGCPRCGELPIIININGPQEVVLDGCGHVIDTTPG